MGVRVVPIPSVSHSKGFVCTATGLVIPDKAIFVGHMPFISPLAALVFFRNMDTIYTNNFAGDTALPKKLGLTPRFVRMCISRILDAENVDLEKVEEWTAGKRGKRSAITEFANIVSTAAVQSGLAYSSGNPFFVPVAACINADAPTGSYIEVLRLVTKLLQTGADLEERFGWTLPPKTCDAYQTSQRLRRQPKPYLVFKCSEETNTPIEVVSKEPAPLEKALDFFKSLLGKRGSFSPIDEPKQNAAKRYAGVSEEGTRYLCTNKYHKDHISQSSSSVLTSSNDDSDGELSQPVEDDE